MMVVLIALGVAIVIVDVAMIILVPAECVGGGGFLSEQVAGASHTSKWKQCPLLHPSAVRMKSEPPAAQQASVQPVKPAPVRTGARAACAEHVYQ